MTDNPKPILTVRGLHAKLTAAIERGIANDTAVVVYNEGWYDEVLDDITDPTVEDNVIWFTLTPAGPADARFTPGHFHDEDAVIDPTVPVVDLVASALQTFWQDSHLSHKAGEYDAAHYVATAVCACRPDLTWSDATLRRAADLAYVVGQFGVDQTTDRQFAAMLAVAIFETEDVL